MARRVVAPALITLLSAAGGASYVHAQSRPAEPTWSDQTASKVYRDLASAMGIARAPKLAIGHTKLSGGEYQPVAMTITLDQRYYPVVRAFGHDSLDVLAFLLGHELAHFSREHNRGGHYWGATSASAITRASAEMEREADEIGLFFGHVAGYQPMQVGPRFLSAFFDPDGGPTPTERAQRKARFDERLSILTAAQARIRPFVHLFEAGFSLLLIGEYERSADLFDFISLRFPSPEMLNNSAAANILAALRDMAAERYHYVVQLDDRTRLSSTYDGRRIPAPAYCDRPCAPAVLTNPPHTIELLTEARRSLEQATSRYPEYLPAQVNLATTLALLGEPSDAVFWIGKALKRAEAEKAASAAATLVMLRGILTGNEADLRLARREHCLTAVTNLLVLRRDLDRTNELAFCGPAPKSGDQTEKSEITETVFNTYFAELDKKVQETICVPTITCAVRRYDVQVGVVQGAGWYGQTISGGGGGYREIVRMNAEFKGATAQGARIGHQAAHVRQLYGTPDRIAAAGRRRYEVYGERDLILIIENDKLAGWLLYD